MGLAITNLAAVIKFELSNGDEYNIDKDNLNIKKKGRHVVVYASDEESKPSQKLKFRYTEVSSPTFISNDEVISTILGWKANTGVTIGDVVITDPNGNVMELEPNGSVPVTLQDQTTPLIVTKFSYLQNSTTLTNNHSIGDYVIQLNDMTDVVVGKLLTLFNPAAVRFTQMTIVNIVSADVYVDTPLDFAYPSGTFVDVQESNLALLGSQASPITCGIRNNAGVTPPPGLEMTFDVTRLIFKCFTSSNPIYSAFGDIAGGLANGLALRRRDGSVYNIFNVKNNGQIAGIMFDFDILTATGQGQPGFKARLTFGGQSKFGAVIRLPINEDLELLIQDDLTSLQRFEIIAEGSIALD